MPRSLTRLGSYGKPDAGPDRRKVREMSQSRKDSARQSTYCTVLEVATNRDGTYEIIFNKKVVASRIPEKWLDDELCAKRGFCGEELASIKRQLDECGRAVVIR
jgi:hypothetical protein